MVPAADAVGSGAHRHAALDPRPRSPPETFPVRALALVSPAARWPHHGRPALRRGDLDGCPTAPDRLALALGSKPRLVRDAHRLSRLSPARADSRSAPVLRAGPSPPAAVQLSAPAQRRGRA